MTRHERRSSDARRMYLIAPSTYIPLREAILSNTDKTIDIIYQNLIDHVAELSVVNQLVISGSDAITLEIKNRAAIPRDDFKNFHEEADEIIVDQVSKVNKQTLLVIADDADIFLLLLHFVHHGKIHSGIYMQSLFSDTPVIDITKTMKKHLKIVPSLLAVHALSDCDTVAALCVIGKKTGLNVLESYNPSLDALG